MLVLAAINGRVRGLNQYEGPIQMLSRSGGILAWYPVPTGSIKQMFTWARSDRPVDYIIMK